MTTRLPTISDEALLEAAVIVAPTAVAVVPTEAERLPPPTDVGEPAGHRVNGRGPERVGALPD